MRVKFRIYRKGLDYIAQYGNWFFGYQSCSTIHYWSAWGDRKQELLDLYARYGFEPNEYDFYPLASKDLDLLKNLVDEIYALYEGIIIPYEEAEDQKEKEYKAKVKALPKNKVVYRKPPAWWQKWRGK